jgi:hypothetical protein
MPDSKVEMLRAFLAQGKGTLSQRATINEFSALTDTEIERVQKLYTDTFGSEARSAEHRLLG